MIINHTEYITQGRPIHKIQMYQGDKATRALGVDKLAYIYIWLINFPLIVFEFGQWKRGLTISKEEIEVMMDGHISLYPAKKGKVESVRKYKRKSERGSFPQVLGQHVIKVFQGPSLN